MMTQGPRAQRCKGEKILKIQVCFEKKIVVFISHTSVLSTCSFYVCEMLPSDMTLTNDF